MEGCEQLGYSIRSAARAIDVSERTIYNLVEAGKLRMVKIGRRSIIPASDLRALVEGKPDGANLRTEPQMPEN